MADALQAVAGRRGWIISDGKAGHEAQARGVAEALGLAVEIKRVAPATPWSWLSPWGPVAPSERFGSAASPFHPPWPDFAFAIGRLTIPYIRRLKQMAGLATYTVILLDPKVSPNTADLFWVPEHDKLRGPNVITTLTAPHTFSREPPGASCAAGCRPRSRRCRARAWPCCSGGPNGDYRYTPPRVAHLVSALQSLGALGAGLMITASRRTPTDVVAFLREQTAWQPHLFWDGEGENPYPQFLAQADAFIVPADSINMTGEPCATGKPIYVFEPEGGSPKFARFHDALRRHGATRPLPARFERLETWSYPPLELGLGDRRRDRAALGQAPADARRR